MMNISLITKALVVVGVMGLVACGGSDKKHSSSSSSVAMSSAALSSTAASSTPASSSAASSVAPVSQVMELGKEYPYTANTKITNAGTTDLVVTQKYYWQTQETKVALKEGSATIE
jgi:hypothetical protein